jgi:hypothetical protein
LGLAIAAINLTIVLRFISVIYVDMISESESEVLSDVEVILPWEVIETCCGLQTNGRSCFLSVNKRDCTTSQLAIHKLEDNSIKLRITVMVLGGYSDDEQQLNGLEVPDKSGVSQEHKDELDNTDSPINIAGTARTPRSPPCAVDAESTDEIPLSRKRPCKGRPRIPNAIDTSRLNKHLTAIWSSKRKKVPKKSAVSARGENAAEVVVQKDVKVNTFAEESPREVESQASTVIIVKTIVRDAPAPVATVPRIPVAAAAADGVVRRSVQDKMQGEAPQRASHDIAERLKAKKRRFTAVADEVPMDGRNIEDHVTCELCGDVVNSYVELVSHVRQDHDDCTYVRSYLDEIIPLAAQLTAISLPCKSCGRTFGGKAALAAHRHECHADSTRESKLGVQRRRVKSELLVTTKLDDSSHNGDSGEMTFVCDICQKAFDSKVKLTRHTHVHSEAQHTCSHCSKRFHHRGNLLKHLERTHGADVSKSPTATAQPCTATASGHRDATLASSRPAKSAPPSSGIVHRAKVTGASVIASQSAQPDTDRFPCTRCSAVFSRMTLLVTHMRYCRQVPGSVKPAIGK